MAKLLAFICLLLVGVPGGLTQNASTNTTSTTTGEDGSIITTVTTTYENGTVITTTTTSMSTEESSSNTLTTGEIDVTLNATTVLDFNKISNTEKMMSAQQLISAANQAFEDVKSVEMAKLNAILSTLKAVQSSLSDVAVKIGPGIANDLFFEGTSKGLFLTSFLKRKDPKLTATEEMNILNFAVQAGTTFKNCISSNTDANNIPTTIVNVGQQVFKLAAADAAFKVAVAKCVVGPINQILQCASNATRSALSSTTPAVDTVLNTKAITENVYKCFDEAANRVRQLGDQVYSTFNSLVSAGDRFVLPSQFDSENKAIAMIPAFELPSAAIDAVKMKITEAKKTVAEAVNSKTAGLASAKAMFDIAVNQSLGILSRLPSDNMTNNCIVAAQQAVESNFMAKAQDILKCVATVPSPPTVKEVSALEVSFLEREQQEKLFLSLARCASNLRNSFDANKLRCCVTEAEADLAAFIDGIDTSLKMSIKKSDLIKSWIQSCAVSSLRSFEKQFNKDLTVLDKCYKRNVKYSMERPKENPYV